MEHAVEIDVSERRRGDELPRSAWVFLSAVVLATLAGAVPALASGAPSGSDLFTFAVLAGGGGGAAVFLARGRRACFGQWCSERLRSVHVRSAGGGSCGRAVLPRRRRLVPRAPHGHRVRDRRRAAPSARAGRARRARPAPSARPQAALPLV